MKSSQLFSVTQQLNDGVRMLQMQAHNNGGTIQLCHTSCVSCIRYRAVLVRNSRLSDQSLFNGGTLQTYLQSGEEKALPSMNSANSRHILTVKSWMDSNTNDGTKS
jgi:hypothetical protein